jgi:capsular polysaccharide biosynthesis protein
MQWKKGDFVDFLKCKPSAFLSVTEIFKSTGYSVSAPFVAPSDFLDFFPKGPYQLSSPSVKAIKFKNVQVMGNSDLVFAPNQCLHHGFYNLKYEQMFEQMHEFVEIDTAENKAFCLKGKYIGKIPLAVSLLGGASQNYAHWLTEVLPKIILIDTINEYNTYPLLIDENLHGNLLESLSILNIRNRDVLEIPRCGMLKVNKLVVVTPCSYAPFDFKPGIIPNRALYGPNSIVYSNVALTNLRKSILERLGVIPAKKCRIFICRRNFQHKRDIENLFELECLMETLGFTFCDPSELSFIEQVKLFADADVVVAQGGASLANMIFAPSGAHIIILAAWSPHMLHYYFTNLASIFDLRCSLILSNPVRADKFQPESHLGLNVCLKTLNEVIKRYEYN